MENSYPSNFDFLQEHSPIFLQLASSAERYFVSDPNTSLMKIRQLGEALIKDLASRLNIQFNERTTQKELINQIFNETKNTELGAIKNSFHLLRQTGNLAVHQFTTRHLDALKGMMTA